VTGGLFWLSQMTQGGTYAGQLLWPMLTTGAGLGLLFVPLSLVALARVADADSGIASSLLNAARQVGAAIGLALLGTVAWTVVADNARAHAAAARASSWQAAYHQALLAGFDRAFLVAAGIGLLILAVAAATIRIRRADLGGS
jgi:hypothetical protein